MVKPNYDFICILFAILIELEKYAFFKIAFLGRKNVHFVLNILFRRRKLFLAFLEFFILLGIFLGRNYFFLSSFADCANGPAEWA